MMKSWARRDEGGAANYGYIFGPAKAEALGLTMEKLVQMSGELSPKQFEDELRKRARPLVVSTAEFVKEMGQAEIEWGLIESSDNEETAGLVAKYPDKLVGLALVDPRDGVRAVKELERAVKELGMKAFLASPFRSGMRQNDKRYYPLYAKAVELGIPMYCYCTMNYRTDRPMDIGRPLYLDEVAIDFPEMTIIAGWGGGGGWPWVPEMIGVARRHQNVYINTSAHRPKYLAQRGSGWDMLLQFGNTLLQDRVVFASGWGNYFSYSKGVLKQVIQEMEALPLKEEVKEKWLYQNAARLFQRG
jgi:predicted TIM-barrel fold metal-dependent hydrolase